MLPDGSDTDDPPGVAETTPPQVVDAPGRAAITTPAGNVSVKGAVRCEGLGAGLPIVIVNRDVTPAGTSDGLKVFETVGGVNAVVPGMANVDTGSTNITAMVANKDRSGNEERGTKSTVMTVDGVRELCCPLPYVC